MNRRLLLWCGLSVAGLISAFAVAGCDYSSPVPAGGPTGKYILGVAPRNPAGAPPAPKIAAGPRPEEERRAILESSITLIHRAALQPGGGNFGEAVKKLNQYFEGTGPGSYLLESAAREFLIGQLRPEAIRNIEDPVWTPRDTRHIEDCMMYYRIARRVAGTGDNLARVRRVFQWVIRQVELVPPGTMGSARTGPVVARPYDVLLRGMATESEGMWAERAWVFMALCRQLEIDCGLITYTRGNVVESRFPSNPAILVKGPRAPIVWICAALIDGQAYLFDARLGLEIPGPGGQGVATLEQALADPSILERMNLPGAVPYGTSRATLLGSQTKIGILIDSSTKYFAPKMRLLQEELAGKDRTILFCDPAEQREHYLQVLGPRAGSVTLWRVPLDVESRLFTDPEYVTAIQNSLFWFRLEFPLIYARVKQLRGEFDEAIEEYGKFRFQPALPMVNNKKAVIPKDVQNGLDVYSTYYQGLAQLERNNLDLAERMFRQTLNMLPPRGPKEPFYAMFRLGASANLARIYDQKNDPTAIAYYTQNDPTPQYVGNMLRARELVWRDPMALATPGSSAAAAAAPGP